MYGGHLACQFDVRLDGKVGGDEQPTKPALSVRAASKEPHYGKCEALHATHNNSHLGGVGGCLGLSVLPLDFSMGGHLGLLSPGRPVWA